MAAKNSTLTHERLCELLHYDPDTGIFRWRVTRARFSKAGGIAGSARGDGYVRICLEQHDYYAHRLAVYYMTGEWPNGQVDHRHGDTSNNVFANLRDVPARVNRQNLRKARVDNKCGLLGVSWSKQRQAWETAVKTDGRQTKLGFFSTPEAAHEAYVQAKRRLHEGCTI